MNVSTRSLRWLGILLFATGAVGCAQPGVSDVGLPTSPSSLSTGPSASLVPPSRIATLGPGASYNASGTWHFVVADIDGTVNETFDTNVTQDANGNLSFLDEDGFPITLQRVGTGVVIAYRLSFTAEGEEGTECDIRFQGTGRLDTRTNTLTANVHLRELGCSHERLGQVVTATKLS